jgi:transcriptional regulator with GAF, ATPase, and Fis domain
MQLVILQPNQAPFGFPLFRDITTIGSDEQCDCHIKGAEVKPVHAELRCEGNVYEIYPLGSDKEVFVNGRKVKKARLEIWDVIRVGSVTMVFAPDDVDIHSKQKEEQSALKHLEGLCDFSRRLMDLENMDKALEALLDSSLSLTRANKGFIILIEDGEPKVKVARNIERRQLPEDDCLFSESIVEKALGQGEPQLITDALHTREFSSCTSVINLRLASVMCVPLKVAGETIGVIYLGTDRLLDMFDRAKLRSLMVYAAQAALIIRHLRYLEGLKKDNEKLKSDLRIARFGSLIGQCPGMQQCFTQIQRVAPTDVPVLILGETGTGKELVARELHQRSHRASGPFVAINCGAIPENLLESELFGHVKGAFTGAVTTTIGKFIAASGGTLFLDEIADLPLSLQVKLLRVLQDGMVYRVGATRPEKVDVRIVTATNKELLAEVKAGRFREDLYYRICVVSIKLPPLRERGEDIEILAHYFLKRFAQELSSPAKQFSAEALKTMKTYSWPGNIRELENRVRKAVLFADGPIINSSALEIGEQEQEVLPLAMAREKFERDYILWVLRKNQGNRTKTARDLGVDPRTIFRYLEKEREAGREFE